MFYSHEILTSREGGVATVWLVATLGSKSNLKKVNRKAILDVNIQKTCDIIVSPEAPMALRLQSNLLYGVSRVYLQQCGYVLSDAQTAQSNMRQLLKSLRTSELDPEAGRARPDQLIVPDDPAFIPELALPGLDIDLSALDISTDDSSRRSSLLSPHSQRSSISSTQEGDESLLGLILPSSGTGGGGSLGGFSLPREDRSSAQRASRMRSILGEEDEGFDFDPGFTFDEQGDIVIHDARAPGQPESTARPGPVPLGSDSAASARVRQEIEEGMRAGQFDLEDQMNLDLDLDLPRFGDDQGALPEAEAFPPMTAQGPTQTVFFRSSSGHPQESSESAEAPIRRRTAAPKYLTMDQQTSLSNNDLASWNNNYALNMASAAQAKQQHKASRLAKKNAIFFIYGIGIGGVGRGLGGAKLPSPLNMFAGDQLMTALGIEPSTRRKRNHADDEEATSDSEGRRRVRAREDDDDEVGRGDNMALDEDDAMDLGMAMQGDDDIEVGRHAVPALEDYSSQMPWNITASAQVSHAGSVARGPAPSLGGFPSSVGGFASSAGGAGSAVALGAPVPGSHDRRSRLTSASPLIGRGRQRYSSIDLPIAEAEDEFAPGGAGSSAGGDSFQMFGPAAEVGTQQAAESQWMRATLDTESNNFLDFMKTEIDTKMAAVGEEGERERDELVGEQQQAREMTFEELLPSARNTKVVAAQALHHLLALATKGLVHVRQVVEYGDIVLGVREGV